MESTPHSAIGWHRGVFWMCVEIVEDSGCFDDRLQCFSSLNEIEQHHNNGNDDEDVNKSSHSVTAHQAQRPQN